MVEDSGVQKDELQPLLPKLRPLEKQLPVALYIAKESGKPLAEVVELRKSERFWLDVMNKTGVKPAVLFEGVQGKFPEPYKAAWIEYRMKFRPEFTDEQIRELVLLQIAHRVSGQPMDEIAKGVTKGKTPEMILARQRKPSPDASAAPVKASETTPAPAQGEDEGQEGRRPRPVTLQIPERHHDRHARGAHGGRQAAHEPHQQREARCPTPMHGRRDPERERQVREGLEVQGLRHEAVQRQRGQAAHDPAHQRDAAAPRSRTTTRPRPRRTRARGCVAISRERSATAEYIVLSAREHGAQRHHQRDQRAQHGDERRHLLRGAWR